MVTAPVYTPTSTGFFSSLAKTPGAFCLGDSHSDTGEVESQRLQKLNMAKNVYRSFVWPIVRTMHSFHGPFISSLGLFLCARS